MGGKELEVLDAYSAYAGAVQTLNDTIRYVNERVGGVNERVRSLEQKAGLVYQPFRSGVYEVQQALTAMQGAVDAANQAVVAMPKQ